jgi:hypothetical protein
MKTTDQMTLAMDDQRAPALARAPGSRAPVDWDEVRKTDDPRVVLRAMLQIWDPEDDAHLSGWGWGEIDLIMAARRVLGLPNHQRDTGPANT